MIYENLIECLEVFIATKNTEFHFTQGKIKFFNYKEEDTICIYGIFILPEYQKCGIFGNFIRYLTSRYNTIYIFQASATLSCILLTTKIKDIYFVNCFTGEHRWSRVLPYDAKKSEEIAKLLIPLKQLMKENHAEFLNLVHEYPYRVVVL